MSKGGSKTKANQEQPAPTPQAPNTGVEISDVGNVDKIRDILFGNQMREYEKRFNRLEKQVMKEVYDLRDESQKRMETFENYFKKEMGILKDRLKSESGDRAESDKKLTHELEDTAASLGKKISQVEENLAERATDIQEQILEQSKKLTTDIQEKYDRAYRELKQGDEELADTKVDRSALSEFLLDMAMRVSGDKVGESMTNTEE